MNKKVIIIVICMVLFITGIIVSWKYLSVIPDNTPETIGNTAGNLNNHGIFCEDNSIVYFSNPYDNDYLYSMNQDGSDKKLILDVPVEYINSAGDYLYYYQKDVTASKAVFGLAGNMHGVYQLKKNGDKQATCLDRSVSGIISLIGNNIYYQHYNVDEGMALYQVSIKDSKGILVSPKIVNPSCVIDGNIYYPDMDNAFYMNVFNTTSLTSSLFVSERVYNPAYANGYIYYMNVADNYSLYRYNSTEGINEKLTNDRVDTFNILGNFIYYQKNDAQNPELKRMGIDGANPETVASGNYTNINMTSAYTYFQAFDSTTPLYRTPTNGSVDVTEFQ